MGASRHTAWITCSATTAFNTAHGPPTCQPQVLPAPPGYQPIYTPARKLMSTPTPMMGGGTPLYHMPVEDPGMKQVSRVFRGFGEGG